MFYFISGNLIAKKDGFIVAEAHGLGFKIFMASSAKLPKIGSKIRLFCYTNIKQDGVDFYGFLNEEELEIFKLLNTVKGVGPKMALKVLTANNSAALISKKRSDILAKKSGISKKTAERIILELAAKIKNFNNDKTTETDINNEDEENLEKILINIGFKKNEIREAIKKIQSKNNPVVNAKRSTTGIKKTEEKLKAVLKILGKI